MENVVLPAKNPMASDFTNRGKVRPCMYKYASEIANAPRPKAVQKSVGFLWVAFIVLRVVLGRFLFKALESRESRFTRSGKGCQRCVLRPIHPKGGAWMAFWPFCLAALFSRQRECGFYR